MFLKSFFGSGVVTAFNALRAFAINKLLAVFLPPAMFAWVGQFLNLLTIGQATSSLAMQNGWTSLTARYLQNEKKLLGVWRGGYRLTTFASVITSVAAVLFCFLAPLETLFPGANVRLVQSAILFALPGIFATNIITICAAVMNGMGENKKWALINIVTSFWQIVWVAFFLYSGRLSVLSVIATQSIVASLFAIQVARRAGFSVKRIWSTAADVREPWLSFALMGIVPMIMTPIILTVIRTSVASNFGNDAAGIWQSILKISDFLFMMMSAILTVIILPKVSALQSRKEFFKLMNPLLLRVMGIAFVSVIVLYLCRSILVQILFSSAYMGAADYMRFQLVGDFFRAGGFALALVLIARRETAKFLSVEIGSEIFLAVGSVVLMKFLEFNGPMAAYAIENALYFAVMYFVVRGLKWKNP